jgi:predicted porin
MRNVIIGAAMAALVATPAFAEEVKIGKMKVDFFGQVQSQLEFDSTDNVDPQITSSRTRFGVKGKQDVGEGVYVLGLYSVDADVLGDGDNDLSTRFGYVGIGHTLYGELQVGKTDSIAEGFVDKADVFTLRGNNGVQKLTRKQKNSVKYTNEFADIKVGAQATMTDDAKNETLDTWQMGAEYQGLGVTYGKDNLNNDTYYGAGYSHKVGPAMFAGSVSMKDSSTDVLGYELVAGYDLNEKTTLLVGWQDTDAVADKGDITTEVNYKFSKQAIGFVDMEYDRTSEEWKSATGVKVKF